MQEQPHHKAALTQLLKYLFIGLLVTGLLIALKLYIESRPLGHKIELLTYEFLHGQIPSFSAEIEMPVVVVDISQVPGGKGGTATPRNILKELIEALVDQKPRAIAVDLDFSPNDEGWIDKKDPEFFKFCLDQRKRGVPIVLGVYRTALQKPEAWLGSEEFKDLAADITINDKDTSRLRLWIQKEGQEPLYSIIAALIKEDNISLPQPPKWLEFALEDGKHEEDTQEESLQSGHILINYSKLEVIQSQALPAISANSIRDLGQKFRNKLIILGDGSVGHATDNFNVPGRSVPVPGVYLHASGVYSLTVEPFYELKQSVRLFIDFALALTILLIVAIIRWKRGNENVDWHRLQRRFILGAILLTLILGILAVRLLNILWLDFFLVIFALLLHPSVENGLVKLFRFRNQNSH